MKSILTILSVFLFSSQLLAFEGIYDGQMKLNGQDVEMSIQVSLKKTGETEVLANGDAREVLEGSFVLDGEGTPYSFSKVILNLDNGWVEMSYYRSNMDVSKNTANFRLFLKIQSDLSLKGNVYSSLWGRLGSVVLKKSSQSHFKIQNKYMGLWRGEILREGGRKVPIELRLASRGGEVMVNPPDYEIHYTAAITASVKTGETSFLLNRVYVDYLRRKLVLSQVDATGTEKMVFDLNFDPVTYDLVGTQSGIWSGDVARVSLFNVKEASEVVQ